MKKMFLMAAAAFMIMFSACTNKSAEAADAVENDSTAIEEVVTPDTTVEVVDTLPVVSDTVAE